MKDRPGAALLFFLSMQKELPGGILQNIAGQSTIRAAKAKEESRVYKVGIIDRAIYSCIRNDIVTDEVIITDERIEHIIKRRGKEFFDRYYTYFGEILQDPDYIFRDKKENTILVCKEFFFDEKYVNLVLRLITVSDDSKYKNSIITAVGESPKRFNQRLRNHNPLYKKE